MKPEVVVSEGRIVVVPIDSAQVRGIVAPAATATHPEEAPYPRESKEPSDQDVTIGMSGMSHSSDSRGFNSLPGAFTGFMLVPLLFDSYCINHHLNFFPSKRIK